MSGSLQLFGDFGFVGGEDVAPNPMQNNQVCINWYAEVNQNNPKEIAALLGCPGLVQLCADPAGGAPGFDSSMTAWPAPSSVTTLPVRGMWDFPGGYSGLTVIGSKCYLVTQATPATSTDFPTLAISYVGTLETSTGPVCIRDNGLGGMAVIVDGPNGYFYNLSTRAFTRIIDDHWVGSDRVAFIDGWWIFNRPGTGQFYTSGGPYTTSFTDSFSAYKDGASDNLVAHIENKELLWLIGERTTEVWYFAGDTTKPFQRLVSTLIQSGCKAVHSVSRFADKGQDSLIWFGRSERGENCILKSEGFNVAIVSNAAFGNEVATYPITSDAIGYTYQEDTHQFYVLTFPTADVTWVFDGQTGLLHKRLSYDPYAQQFHRHRSNCYMNFAGMKVVGDYQNGAIYQLTRNAQTDAGWPILAKRRSPHVWDGSQRGRVFMWSLQIEFTAGVGNASGLGSDPQAQLAISRDGGRTFGNRHPRSIGKAGKFQTRTMWRRLAISRDAVFDLEVIDPVPRDIVGATLKAFSSA
jgi:hypothetical protein